MVYIKLNSGFSRSKRLEHDLENIIVIDSKKVRVVGLYLGFKLYEGETLISNFERSIK